MGATELFCHWRMIRNPGQSWGLAWFLAYEFCRRYYSSHGIVPHVIDHEGLGYYGIRLDLVQCSRHPSTETAIGRMTIGGDVENWRTGSPGDHSLPTMEMCSRNISTEEIVQKAVAHMGIDPIPSLSHVGCRHQRWGSSYNLCFEIATMIALKNEYHDIQIWNHPYHTDRVVSEYDPQSEMKEHMGAFLFNRGDKQLILTADGRLLDGSELNLWHIYMNGHGISYISDLIETHLGRY